MNLAIEYILRGKRARNLLQIPCSFFLVNKVTYGKVVVSINHCYGKDELVNVKHWDLTNDSANRMLPPFKEQSVKTSDLFIGDNVVVPDHRILEYTETPYAVGEKQYTDHPTSSRQVLEYCSALDKLFNTDTHHQIREDWLWTAFEEKHVPESLKWKHEQHTTRGKRLQRGIVELYNKAIWKKWLYWKRHLDINQSWIAPELILRWEYNQNIPTPEETSTGGSIWGGSSYHPFFWSSR